MLPFGSRLNVEGTHHVSQHCARFAYACLHCRSISSTGADSLCPLAGYFAGSLKEFSVKLVYPGSPFEQKVWNALLSIPFGSTASYEDVAKKIKSPKSSRAVGRANGFNRIAIVIPCHRVINKSGELGGYGGGLWRKKMLLELERKV